MIYTSYFGNINKLKKLGYTNFISIAGKTPDWFTGKKYKFFAPKYYWWKEWHDNNLSEEWYKQKYYETVLNNISVKDIEEILELLGENPILLCYETPEKFCHRHLIADFFNKNGFKCIEL